MNLKYRATRAAAVCGMAALGMTAPALAKGSQQAPLTAAGVLEASSPGEWRRPEPANTLYLELASGRVVIELAPGFAPAHVANIRTLVRAGYYDGAVVVRAQDNYVVQWGRPEEAPGPTGEAKRALPGEYSRATSEDMPFTRVPDADSYAPETGFSDGFPVARDAAAGTAWLVHCYGMVGAGRGMAPDSGSGAELYAVTGHAPRHLDLNVTLVGRVISGIERLSVLPRGGGPLGFYESAEEHAAIISARMAVDLPVAERVAIELLRTDSASFAALIEARRSRREDWFIEPTGRIEVCNVPLPTRAPSRPD